MANDIAESTHGDPRLLEEAARLQSAFREATALRESELNADFQAAQHAGFIDPKKMASYMEARKAWFEELKAAGPPADAVTHQARLRKTHEKILQDQLLNWLKPGGPGPLFPTVCDTYASAYGIEGGTAECQSTASGTTAYTQADNTLHFHLSAMGDATAKAICQGEAQAIGWVVFKIPGAYIPHGIVRVCPYIHLHGMIRVLAIDSFAKFLPGGYGAKVEIGAETRLYQSEQFPITDGTILTATQSAYAPVFEDASPPIQAWGGWRDINDVQYVEKARATLAVKPGIDLYAEVCIRLYCYAAGLWTQANVIFDGNNFIKILHVSLDGVPSAPSNLVVESE